MTPEIALQRHVGPRNGASAGFRVSSFVPGDYVAVHASRLATEWAFDVPDPWAVGRTYRDMGPCFTGWFRIGGNVNRGTSYGTLPRDIPLVCAGLTNLTGGRFSAWAVLALALLAGPPRDLAPARHWLKGQIRQRLPILMGEHGVQRLEADVPAGGLNFVRSLGFQIESVMPLWHDGQTFYKYVRFRGQA